ncbi:GntR family transcriptional regulator [bacterium]|nr:MAG: GntR family transcriptional regulator [bacterium]
MKDLSLRVEKVAAPLRQQVFERLRDAITSCRFLPGQRLIERELCELLGVSRTSVREALRQLESEGLITSVPHRGPIVATVSLEEAESIYEVRAVLEALAGRLFAERANTAQRRELDAAFEQIKIDFKRSDAQSRLSAKTHFYAILMDGSGNEILMGQLKAIQGRITLLRATSLSSPGRSQKTLKELERIMAAIDARDGNAAWKACLDHVRSAAAVAKHILAERDRSAAAAERKRKVGA